MNPASLKALANSSGGRTEENPASAVDTHPRVDSPVIARLNASPIPGSLPKLAPGSSAIRDQATETVPIDPLKIRIHQSAVDRPEWRQRLVEIEKGLATALRTDSTLFMHLFFDSIIIASGAVLGLHLWQWVALTATLMIVLTVELLSQAIRRLALLAHRPHEKRTPLTEVTHQTEALCFAASFVTILGGLVITTLIFAQRIYETIPE